MGLAAPHLVNEALRLQHAQSAGLKLLRILLRLLLEGLRLGLQVPAHKQPPAVTHSACAATTQAHMKQHGAVVTTAHEAAEFARGGGKGANIDNSSTQPGPSCAQQQTV
jgi:hypothetical protein